MCINILNLNKDTTFLIVFTMVNTQVWFSFGINCRDVGELLKIAIFVT